jgi:predicted amidohydrolase
VVVGTGTPAVSAAPGFSIYREMTCLHAAGLSLEEVWVAATRAAGEALGVSQLGSIEVGAPADLLIFRQDPTRDLAALNTLEAVVMRGRLYMSQPRVHMAMDHIKYFDRWLYDWGTRAWARLTDWWDPSATRACAAL